MPRAWVVLIEEDMIGRWVFYGRVPLEDQQAVRAWIKDLEESGPPAIVAYSPDGSPIARVGDTDMRVEFEVVATPLGFATPPYGLIKVYEILGRGSMHLGLTDPDDFAEWGSTLRQERAPPDGTSVACLTSSETVRGVASP